ncbi:DUF6868 family protein [Litorilituus sediminis]|uniref:DUF6868 domain-containing protein n=1 Tax=Litorilituus sediminis TaxID=718192 RepID=A0A4P6PA64_9GAMM|nr:hypothetical protein [Litorilituus sediminis]QBG36447.1 hypothetical protein EMK97_12330 [Litorilituus sediminis]
MNNLNEMTLFFGWCSLINIGILMLTTISLTLFRTSISKIHAKLMQVEEKTLPSLYFNYLANYKVLILVFNLVPYLVLKMMA